MDGHFVFVGVELVPLDVKCASGNLISSGILLSLKRTLTHRLQHLITKNMLHRKTRSLWHPINLVVVALLLFTAGCATTKISAINSDPASYMAKDVTVAGQVINSFGVANQGAFEVDDGTGRLWVWSNGFGVPSQGVRVIVTGRVPAGVAFGGRFFANVLRETQPHKTA